MAKRKAAAAAVEDELPENTKKLRRANYVQYKCNLHNFWTTITENRSEIGKKAWDRLKKCPFWGFIKPFYNGKITKDQVSKSDELISRLVSFYDAKTAWFVFGDRRMHTTAADVQRTFGIPNQGKHMDVSGRQSKGKTEFIKRNFSGCEKVCKADIDAALKKALKEGDKEDVAALLIMGLLASFLLCSSGASLSWNIINLITPDLATLKQFNWAEAVVDSMTKGLSRVEKDKSTAAISGCVMLVMYWVCDNTAIMTPIPGRETEEPTFVKWGLPRLHASMLEISDEYFEGLFKEEKQEVEVERLTLTPTFAEWVFPNSQEMKEEFMRTKDAMENILGSIEPATSKMNKDGIIDAHKTVVDLKKLKMKLEDRITELGEKIEELEGDRRTEVHGAAQDDKDIERRRQKSPSTIELLDGEQCKELEVDGASLPAVARAGEVPPEEIVAIVRPGNHVYSSSSNSLDQKYIVKSNLEMSMEVNFRGNANEHQNVQHIYSVRVGPKSLKGIQGLYVFPVKHRLHGVFRSAGIYTFSFHLNESDCKSAERSVRIKPSSKEVGKWVLLNNDQPTPYRVSVGSVFQPLSIACYDVYDNRIPFATTLEVAVKVQKNENLLFHVEKFTKEFSTHTLTVKDMLMESSEIDKLRPTYEASLVVCTVDGKFSITVPCEVIPGPLQHVKAIPPIFEDQVLPGYTIQDFILEMFDQFGNHVIKGTEVQLNLEGFSIQDRLGTARTVDNNGCIDLGGLLKVTAGYDKSVSLSVYSENNVLLNLQSQTEKRALRITSEVPDICVAGTQLESVVFEIANSDGVVDDTIHHEEKSGQLHMLTIKAGSSLMEESLRFTFKHGRCTVPAISVPEVGESFTFVAAHSCYPELHVNVKVPVVSARKDDHLLIKEEKYDESPTPWEVSPLRELPQQVGNLMVPKLEHQGFPSPCSTGNTSPLPDLSCLQQSENIKELENSQNTMHKHGTRVGDMEEKLKILEEKREAVKQELFKLQGSIEPYKVELINRIESMRHTAAAIICTLSREVSFEEANNHFLGDVIGLVALLGTVSSNNLSRILAEYLGKDQMLAIVCKSFEAACALEKFVQSDHGEVDSIHSLCEPALLHKPTHGRSYVICLEDIRPYTGDFDRSDPQRKLALPDPVSPTGMAPDGFLGYAVNMVELDSHHLHTVTSAGHGLRETVLYCLFGELQVYKTRKDMLAARACIKHGAISLDGGILKKSGVTSFGAGDVELCFPVATSLALSTSTNVAEVEEQIEKKKSSLTLINDGIEAAKKLHRRSLKKFKKAKKSAHKILENMRLSQEQSSSPMKEGRQFVSGSSSQSS